MKTSEIRFKESDEKLIKSLEGVYTFEEVLDLSLPRLPDKFLTAVGSNKSYTSWREYQRDYKPERATRPDKSNIDRFSGSPFLRKGGIRLNWSSDDLKEFIRCRDDLLYFACEYGVIQTTDDGLIKFKPRYYQRLLLWNYQRNRKVICCWSRQIGKSTCASICMLWGSLFRGYQNVLLLAHKESRAVSQLREILSILECLPCRLSAGVLYSNVNALGLDNGSVISAFASSSDGVRGIAASHIFVDELAYIDNAAHLMRSTIFPSLKASRTSKILICSTPNGTANTFAEIWNNAQDEESETFNGFVFDHRDWRAVNSRLFKFNGKDYIFDDGKEYQREALADVNGDRRVFASEQLADFVGSSSTLIDGAVIEELTKACRAPDLVYSVYGFDLNVFDRPKRDRKGLQADYLVSVDCADKGVDETVITVIKWGIDEKRVVARLSSRDMRAEQISPVAIKIAQLYNQAWIVIERCLIGGAVAERARASGYEYLYYETHEGSTNQFTGLKMSPGNKKLGCDALKSFVETEGLEIPDRETVEQFRTFVLTATGHYKGDPTISAHDDKVMALVVAARALTDIGFMTLFFDRTHIQPSEESIVSHVSPFPGSFRNNRGPCLVGYSNGFENRFMNI